VQKWKVGEVKMTEYIVRYENEYLQLLPDKMQELVRCKDCKHHETSEVFDSYCNNLCTDVPMDWFCADGVKK
jgi:hypothetical protein